MSPEDFCQIVEENELPERLLQDVGAKGIEGLVEEMTLDQVVAYARRHRIDFEEPSQWLDDEYPVKESWLRVTVMEHMAARKEDSHG